MTDIPTITLSDGVAIPQVGFGVFQIAPDETAAAVLQAFEAGYRHIDTAQMYENEEGVGKAVASSGLPRDEVFVTTKLSNAAHRPDDAREAFDRSLERLGLDHVDLFLMHWPLPMLYDGDFVSTWQTMVEFHREGRARSVGVSNFEVAHLERLADETDHKPSVNQIEVHPYFGNETVRAYGQKHEIVTEAWSPIDQGRVLADDTISHVANEIGRTPAQVVLRWHVQRGDVVFPKTVSPERMKENVSLFDFSLDDEKMRRISALDRGEQGRRGPHPERFASVPR